MYAHGHVATSTGLLVLNPFVCECLKMADPPTWVASSCLFFVTPPKMGCGASPPKGDLCAESGFRSSSLGSTTPASFCSAVTRTRMFGGLCLAAISREGLSFPLRLFRAA